MPVEIRPTGVWAFDEHATLLSTSFLRTRRVQDLAAGEIGNDVGEIKCRGDDSLGSTDFAPSRLTKAGPNFA